MKTMMNLSASMGPRLFSRGNADGPGEQFLDELEASMGPRLFSRGNNRGRDLPSFQSSRFNGATTFQPWKSGILAASSATYITLQWGHDFSAVEIAAVFRPQQMPKN